MELQGYNLGFYYRKRFYYATCTGGGGICALTPQCIQMSVIDFYFYYSFILSRLVLWQWFTDDVDLFTRMYREGG